jgi:enediyne biosynthesis protein E3
VTGAVTIGVRRCDSARPGPGRPGNDEGDLDVGAGMRAARRRVLTPAVSATLLRGRGFHRKDRDTQELLERIGRTFLAGFGSAAAARAPVEAEPDLEAVPPRFRGFAYEGAATGFAVRDGLPLGRHDLVEDFLQGRAADHQHLAYVGVGGAMARLPRVRWVRPDRLDPLLRWLVLDGYGFHQTCFRTRRYVEGHARPARLPWPGGDSPDGYPHRVVDQGIGRALWFVGGADPWQVTALIHRFPPDRRADLYGGAGLAATYAGGASADELTRFREDSGEHCGQVALGAAFAAQARVRAGLVGPETELATEVLCAVTPAAAARLTQRLRPDPADVDEHGAGEPAYETWRQRVATALVPGGARR